MAGGERAVAWGGRGVRAVRAVLAGLALLAPLRAAEPSAAWDRGAPILTAIAASVLVCLLLEKIVSTQTPG